MKLPFLRPMLAQQRQEAFDSEEYLFEIKWDGYRCLAYHSDGILLRSRNGKDFTQQFQQIISDLASLPSGYILDGELVILDKRGRPDFSALQHKSRDSRVTYIVFDMLYCDNVNICKLPLIERRKRLHLLFGGQNKLGCLWLAQAIETQGKQYYQLAIHQGLEGIMAKHKHSRYLPGLRSPHWYKIKHRLQIDAVVVGYSPAKQGFKSLYLALYADDGLHYIGNVGTGFSVQERRILLSGFASIRQKFAPWPLSAGIREGVWVKPLFVAIINYLEFTPDLRLRQPSFVGLRSDKHPTECTLDDKVGR